MESSEKINEELEKIRKNRILEINNWWGLRSPGSSGTIITYDRKVFVYQFLNIKSNELENEKRNYIYEKKELNIEEYNQVIEFIKNEIINKEFERKRMYDIGFSVIVNYNENQKEIENEELDDDDEISKIIKKSHEGIEDKELYDKTREFLHKLIYENK